MLSNEYYPFGMQTANSWTRAGAVGNNFLANGGTELNVTTSLYDLDFRNYDPLLGRMHQVDPMALLEHSSTPYHFASNNPISLNDPLGLFDNWDQVFDTIDDLWDSDHGGTSDEHGNKHEFDDEKEEVSWARASKAQQDAGGGGSIVAQTSKKFNVVSGKGAGESEVAYAIWKNVIRYIFVPGASPDLTQDDPMTLSPEGLAFIQAHEGFGKNGVNPYNDDRGFATVGYGHLLHYSPYTKEDVAKYSGMTKDQGLILLYQDLRSRVDAVNNLVKVPLTQYQFDAMVSFTFNVGIGSLSSGTGLAGSQFLNQLNQGNYDGSLMMNFHTPASIIGRRQDEIDLFTNGEY